MICDDGPNRVGRAGVPKNSPRTTAAALKVWTGSSGEAINGVDRLHASINRNRRAKLAIHRSRRPGAGEAMVAGDAMTDGSPRTEGDPAWRPRRNNMGPSAGNRTCDHNPGLCEPSGAIASAAGVTEAATTTTSDGRSEEHTSELQ